MNERNTQPHKSQPSKIPQSTKEFLGISKSFQNILSITNPYPYIHLPLLPTKKTQSQSQSQSQKSRLQPPTTNIHKPCTNTPDTHFHRDTQFCFFCFCFFITGEIDIFLGVLDRICFGFGFGFGFGVGEEGGSGGFAGGFGFGFRFGC